MVTRLWLHNSRSRVSSCRSYGRYIVEKKVANDKKKLTFLTPPRRSVLRRFLLPFPPLLLPLPLPRFCSCSLSVQYPLAKAEEDYRALPNDIVQSSVHGLWE